MTEQTLTPTSRAVYEDLRRHVRPGQQFYLSEVAPKFYMTRFSLHYHMRRYLVPEGLVVAYIPRGKKYQKYYLPG